MNSTYTTTCLCGAPIRTVATTGTCPACGRDYEIQWPADYRPKPNKNGELPTL